MLEGLRGEDSIAELCRKEAINQNLYYRWSKEFLEAGKKRLAGDTARDEVKELKAEARHHGVYRFGYVAELMRPKQAAASHASELPFLFDTLDVRYGECVTAKDRAAAKAFGSYVINFVKSGQPNGQGLPTWPKFDPVQSELMAFTPDNGPIAQTDPWKDRLDLVERVADRHAFER